MKKVIFNKHNIVVLLFLLAAISTLVVFFRAKTKKAVYKNQEVSFRSEDRGVIDEGYRKSIKEIMNSLNDLTSSIGLYSTSTEIFIDQNGDYKKKAEELRAKIITLRSPLAESKDLHIGLVTALDNIILYLETHLDKEKINSLDKIEKTRNTYELLNY